MGLTRDQIDLFHHNGYLKLPGRFTDAQLDQARGEIRRLMDQAAEPVQRNDDGIVHRISRVHERGGVFEQFAADPVIIEPLTDLIGPNIVLARNRHNHATLNLPGYTGAYWHRDVSQWTRNFVSVIIYLEESTIDNGCTRVVPGTHRMPVFLSAVGDITEDQTLQQSGVLDQAMPVPMPAGGVLAINSVILHSIGTNTSDATRMSMTYAYHGVDELDKHANPECVLVNGTQIYSGNDDDSLVNV